MLSVSIDVTLNRIASSAVRSAQLKRLRDAGAKGFAVSQQEAPEDRGQLRQSGFSPTWTGEAMEWGYRGPSYLRPMEFGTKPYWPPIDPLKEWADRVFGDPSIGYAVQQKIAKEGVDAHPYVRPGIAAQRRYLRSHSFNEYLINEFE